MEEFTAAEAAHLHAVLLPWFDAHRRRLPWRGDAPPYAGVSGGDTLPAPPAEKTAYGIWVSEVMLQQTRVTAVIPFWLKWMARFPTPAALAAAEADAVSAAWAGLGYYSRARNLQAGAAAVVRDFGGRLPGTAAALRQLAGVGPYTAGAVASIAFGERAAAVDGNVVRVLARLRGAAAPAKDAALRAACWAWAAALVPPQRPGAWTEALMELGATVCTPRAPACGGCPARGACAAFSRGAAAVAAAGGGGGVAGDVEDAAGKWVAERYPPPAAKKAPRREAWRAVVVSWRPPAGGGEAERRLLVLRTPAGGGADGGAGKEEGEEEEEEEEGAEGAEAEGGGGSGAKRKRGGALLGGQWRPCLAYLAAPPAAAAPAAAPPAAGKRARSPAAAAAAAAAAALPPAPRALAEDVAALLSRALDGARLAGAPPSPPPPGATHALGRLSLRAVGGPAAGKHVFSGVTHELVVSHWELLGGAAEAEALRAAGAGRGGEAKWATLAELVENGLTTWAAKVLFLGLAAEARAALGGPAEGAPPRALAAPRSEASSHAAWRAVEARWKKAHCKLW